MPVLLLDILEVFGEFERLTRFPKVNTSLKYTSTYICNTSVSGVKWLTVIIKKKKLCSLHISMILSHLTLKTTCHTHTFIIQGSLESPVILMGMSLGCGRSQITHAGT